MQTDPGMQSINSLGCIMINIVFPPQQWVMPRRGREGRLQYAATGERDLLHYHLRLRIIHEHCAWLGRLRIIHKHTARPGAGYILGFNLTG